MLGLRGLLLLSHVFGLHLSLGFLGLSELLPLWLLLLRVRNSLINRLGLWVLLVSLSGDWVGLRGVLDGCSLSYDLGGLCGLLFDILIGCVVLSESLILVLALGGLGL